MSYFLSSLNLNPINPTNHLDFGLLPPLSNFKLAMLFVKGTAMKKSKQAA